MFPRLESHPRVYLGMFFHAHGTEEKKHRSRFANGVSNPAIHPKMTAKLPKIILRFEAMSTVLGVHTIRIVTTSITLHSFLLQLMHIAYTVAPVVVREQACNTQSDALCKKDSKRGANKHTCWKVYDGSKWPMTFYNL